MPHLDQLEDLIARQLDAMGYELVDFRPTSTQHGKALRILADCAGGMSVGDCERISREVSYLLEEQDWGLTNYRLEVSSPGLDRPLKKLEEFQRHSGLKVALKTKEAHEGRRNYRGYIHRVEGKTIFLKIEGVEFEIQFDDIQSAHLVYAGEEKASC